MQNRSVTLFEVLKEIQNGVGNLPPTSRKIKKALTRDYVVVVKEIK